MNEIHASTVFQEGIEAMQAEDWTGALRKFDQAIDAFEDEGDVHGMVWPLTNKCTVLAKLGRMDEAFQCWDNAVGYCERLLDIGWDEEIAHALAVTELNRGQRFSREKNDFAAAGKVFDRAIELLERTVYQDGVRGHLADLAAAYEVKTYHCLCDTEDFITANSVVGKAIRLFTRLLEEDQRTDLAEQLDHLNEVKRLLSAP